MLRASVCRGCRLSLGLSCFSWGFASALASLGFGLAASPRSVVFPTLAASWLGLAWRALAGWHASPLVVFFPPRRGCLSALASPWSAGLASYPQNSGLFRPLRASQAAGPTLVSVGLLAALGGPLVAAFSIQPKRRRLGGLASARLASKERRRRALARPCGLASAALGRLALARFVPRLKRRRRRASVGWPCGLSKNFGLLSLCSGLQHSRSRPWRD